MFPEESHEIPITSKKKILHLFPWYKSDINHIDGIMSKRGFHKWWYPNMDGLYWENLWNWMIWGYPHDKTEAPSYIQPWHPNDQWIRDRSLYNKIKLKALSLRSSAACRFSFTNLGHQKKRRLHMRSVNKMIGISMIIHIYIYPYFAWWMGIAKMDHDISCSMY